MNTLLGAIKKYPKDFITAIYQRADTTPSEINRMTHETLAECITLEMWEEVENILTLNDYQKPLEGVVFCLNIGYDYDTKSKIIDLFEEGKLV